MEVKYYEINDKVYSFDIIDSCNTLKGIMLIGICKENGKSAWLDPTGVQFYGDSRIPAHEVKPHCCLYGYTIWGGQIRDTLPHGRRYYMGDQMTLYAKLHSKKENYNTHIKLKTAANKHLNYNEESEFIHSLHFLFEYSFFLSTFNGRNIWLICLNRVILSL